MTARRLAGICLVLALMAGTAPAQDQPSAVLNAGSPWRVFCSWKTEVVRSANGDLGPVKDKVGRTEWKPRAVRATPLPAAEWTLPDFDDASWARFQTSALSGSRELALICLRAKFTVTDPATAGDLDLSVSYMGGAIVYLNGKEIARNHLPKDQIGPETPADDYPKDAYLDPDNMLLRHGFGDPEKYRDRFALRTREIKNVKVPASVLRKGVNVLAVELHRAPTDEVLIVGKSKTMASFGASYSQWSMLRFINLTLAAPATDGLVPNAARPKGLHAWPLSVVSKVAATDYADASDPARPLHITGCRNGSFSGQIVVNSTDAIHDLKIEPRDLKTADGKALIAAASVAVRFARGENLEPAPVPELAAGTVQPVWITVRVPRDAAPGDYTGEVTATAGGADAIRVPLRLHVAAWALPDSKDFASHVGMPESPDSVALQYAVPLWSNEHWKLLDKVFELLGQVGEDDLFIPLICGTYHGNAETMVRWIKQPDGTFKHDFTIAEKYLDLAVKHLGKPPVVCLYIWDRQGATWGPLGDNRDLGDQKDPAPITLLDPATGKVERMGAPKWGTPESTKFWKPVIDGLRDRLKTRGLERSMMVGVALDNRPKKATVDDLKAIAPDARWVLQSHCGAAGAITQDIIGYGSHVWISHSLVDPDKARGYLWTHPYIFTAFPRYGCGGAGSISSGTTGVYRFLIEGLVASGHRGAGRFGADFWPVRKGREKAQYLIGGDQGDVSVTLFNSTPAVLGAGAKGPVATVRFELLREGVQETEARIFIEKVLTDPAARGKLGDELAARAQKVLDERVRMMIRGQGVEREQSGFLSNWNLLPAMGWQALSEALYGVAAEVAAKTAQP